MILADRAGIGLWAILSIGLTVLYANGMIGPVPQGEKLESLAPWSHTAPTVISTPTTTPHSDNPFMNANGTPKLLTDEEFGILPASKADIGDLLSLIILKAGVYCALPIWIIIRIIDFIVGGPARRRKLICGFSHDG